eukprot:1196233-Prorocentrum_minimum.AAC.10
MATPSLPLHLTKGLARGQRTRGTGPLIELQKASTPATPTLATLWACVGRAKEATRKNTELNYSLKKSRLSSSRFYFAATIWTLTV